MKSKSYNEDPTCKAMQNAALSELLITLKLMTSFEDSAYLYSIFYSVFEVLDKYDCISCKCLKNRAESIMDDLDFSDIHIPNIKAFIIELETFLNSENSKKQCIKL